MFDLRSLAPFLRLLLETPLWFANVNAHFQSGGQNVRGAQNHGENGLPANRFELLVIVRGLVGAPGPAVLGRVHVKEARDHLVAIESGQQERRGFTGAHHEFSGAVGHSEVSSCTRLRAALQ